MAATFFKSSSHSNLRKKELSLWGLLWKKNELLPSEPCIPFAWLELGAQALGRVILHAGCLRLEQGVSVSHKSVAQLGAGL